jgi:hypothetical protein
VGGSGALTLDFGDTTVPAQIVGVANRFPAAAPNGGAFVVADESRLSTALDADAPGTGTPGELWLSAPPQALAGLQRQLGRPPFDRLQLASQRGLERALASNPLARGIELSLLAAAALALALATLGLWATASSDLHDERGEYFDLEAQGVPPVVLRRQLWLRSFVVLALGAAGGVGVGLLVSRIVVYHVRTSASATLTEPPLVSVTSWLPAAVAFLVVAAAAAGGVALAARAAFRGDTPERSAWSLE